MHTLKVLKIVQVVNDYITQSKMILSFFGNELFVKQCLSASKLITQG